MNFKYVGGILNGKSTSENTNNKDNYSDKQVENECAHDTTKHFYSEKYQYQYAKQGKHKSQGNTPNRF